MKMLALWWWIDRWRKSTAYTDMTLEEQGAYRNLLDEATLRGGALPNNERILAKACGDALAWKRVRAAVLARFELREDGWHNVTLDSVLVKGAYRADKQKRYREGRNGPTIRAIVDRDGSVCGICAEPIETNLADIDHIIPASRGGHVSDVRNLQLAHPKCNQKKGSWSRRRHESLLVSTPGFEVSHATLPLSQGNDQSNDQCNSLGYPDPVRTKNVQRDRTATPSAQLVEISVEIPKCPDNSPQSGITTPWKRTVAICHAVIDTHERADWSHEVKARMAQQGLPLDERGGADQRELWSRALDYTDNARQVRAARKATR